MFLLLQPALFPVYQELDPKVKGKMPLVLAYTMAASVTSTPTSALLTNQ